MTAMRRALPPLGAIFITVFLDLLSFGMVIPDIQLRGAALGAEGFVRGLVIAVFSIAQLATAPLVGRLSDAKGRRPVLLVTTLLATLSFIAYANSHELWIMFVSRILAGIAGANIGVAYAYVADVTTPADRPKGMGLIGAAFGLGFILGPVTGAELVRIGGGTPVVLGYTAATLAFLNFLYVLVAVPESLTKDSSDRRATLNKPLATLLRALRTPGLAILLLLFFAYNLSFSNLESTYFLLATGEFALSQSEAARILAWVGVVGAFMQGYMIRIVSKRFRELSLLRVAFLAQAPILMCVPFARPWIPQLIGATLLGIASGLAQPSLGSLISKTAPPDMQGGIFGVTQALGAMARILGPLAGNALFDVRYWAPYALAAVIMLVPAIAAFRIPLGPKDDASDGPAGAVS